MPANPAPTVLSRLLRIPPPSTRYRVRRKVPVPMRDGVELLADHFMPDTDTPTGTLLVRGPYGRRWPFSALYATSYARRGYHVILQSVRGTFGSGGVFDPPVNEVADGADTAAWLREQPWYTGSFGTVGLSYLGQTQWALLQSPPEDMVAAVVAVGVHDFAASCWGTGAFSVNDFLGWSNMIAHQEDRNKLAIALNQLRGRTVVNRVAAQVPLAAAGRKLLGTGAPWWERWVEHPDPNDPFWQRYRFYRGLDHARVPVLLIGGWQDLFLEQTIMAFHRLHGRDVDVAMTIGPWTHTHMVGKASPTVLRESLDWLDAHFGGRPARRPDRVRAFVTGGLPARRAWLTLPDWPPTTGEQVWFLDRDGLSSEPGADGSATFTFDPRRPTPTVGGRLLSPNSGIRRDDGLARRPDVLTYTGPVLTSDLYVYGGPVIELSHSSDNPHVDVFVRVSEVDAKGRSRNVSDGYRRLVQTPGTRLVRIELEEVAHRFRAGSRLRVLVAGGSHPRFARNLGSGESQATGSRLVPATHTVQHGGLSRLVLPVGLPPSANRAAHAFGNPLQ